MDYKHYIEKMNDFKKIDWVCNQLHLAKKPNFWSILEYGEGVDYSAHEIRTSRMIRWLMDANETHHVGNLFAQKLISFVDKNVKYEALKSKDIHATAEYENIDIFYRDLHQGVCAAIEVKQHAKEGITSNNESQLDKYEKIVKSWIETTNENIQAYYIFLTPQQTEPTNKNWRAVGYEKFIELIGEFIFELEHLNPPYKEDTIKIVTDFKEDLQRTLEFQCKNHQKIKEELSDDEKKLTLKLAGGELVDEFERELQLAGVDRTEFYEIVQLVQKYLYAQNHAPNKEVSLLMRKIYNYFAQHPIDINQLYKPIKRGMLTDIKPSIIRQYDLAFTKINLTAGKGQGIFLNNDQKEQRIYMSGDTYGNFPNDGIQLLTYEGKEQSIVRSKLVKRNEFMVDGKIQANKVKDRNDQLIDFEDFMEQVMKAIQELNEGEIVNGTR